MRAASVSLRPARPPSRGYRRLTGVRRVLTDASEIRDAAWMAINDGRLDGRDQFLHLAWPCAPRTEHSLFLFACVMRALRADELV